MSSTEKKALYGAKQEVILTPKEGFEIDSIEVINKTINEVVPSQLTKTCDNPPQWTCTFVQPAGVVAIRPKMKPIFYSVIIEECENCSIVLIEASDDVDIKFSSTNDETEENAAGGSEQNEPAGNAVPNDEKAEDNSTHTAGNEDSPASAGSDKPSEAPGEMPETNGEDTPVNFNEPQHSKDNDAHAEEASNVEEQITNDAADATQDTVYDAGEFASELKDVEPIVLTQAEVDLKHKAFWQHRTAFNAGQISKEEFAKVEKKHMEFLDGISSGLIEVRES